MKLLYVSNYMDKKYFENIYVNAKEKPIQNIQKFNKLFVSGFEQNELIDNITVLTNASVNKNISDKLFWKGKNKTEGKVDFWYMPFINLKILKQICIFFMSIFYVIYWCLKNINNECILISDGFFPIVCTVATVICRLFGIRVITLYTDLPKCSATSLIENKSTFRRFVDFIINIGDKINIISSDMFIFLTKQMNDLINKKDKPYIIMEGLVDSKFDTNVKCKKKKAIMYAGGLYTKYGVKLLIDSFLEWNNDEYELWLCGSGDLNNYISELNNNKVKYFGTLPNTKIIEMERKATLLVNPRPTTEEFTKYSFPSKNMEYMLSGTPVLTTKLPGMPKEYNDKVFLIDEENEKGFIKIFDELLANNNEDELNKKALYAQKYVTEEKNNIIQTKKIIDLFNSKEELKKDDKKTHFYIAMTLCTLLTMVGLFTKNVEISKLALTFLYILITLKSFLNYKKYLILIVFLISFFTFGLGQYFFDNVTNDFLYYKNFPNTYVVRTIFLQYLSLIFAYVGYELILKYNNTSKKINKFMNDNKSINTLKKFVTIMFFITFLCSLVINIEKIIFVQQYDYLSLYTDLFQTKMPSIITRLSSYFLIFFMFYLSLEKSVKKIIISLIMFIMIIISNLLIGTRFMFVFGVIFISFYALLYIFDNKIRINSSIKKKMIIATLVVIPMLIVFLSVYNTIRNDRFNNELNPIYEIKAFFVSQGRSVNLITYAQMYKEKLLDGKTDYVFGDFKESISKKISMVTNSQIKSENCKTKFAIEISKIVLGEESVKKGNGLGSNYIAEIYLEYGYIGIILFNILIGSIICYFYINYDKNFINKFLCLSFISPLTHIPRGAAYEMISIFVSFTFYFIILIYIFIYVINKEKKI